MKSKLFFTGILSILLVFGLVLTGCDNGTDGGGDDKGNKVIPSGLIGSWYRDYNQNGILDGNEESLGVAFQFKRDGTMRRGDDGDLDHGYTFYVYENYMDELIVGANGYDTGTMLYELNGKSLALYKIEGSGLAEGFYVKR